jgi:hypothetical protein
MNIGEERSSDYLSSFRCQRNEDVERFLRKIAIPQEKGMKSRTYLIVDADPNNGGLPEILAYYTLAIHIMTVSNDVNTTLTKKLVMFYDAKDEVHRTPCFLIGQIGKNDSNLEATDGDEIIHRALDMINMVHRTIGGRFIKIDCGPCNGLLSLYQRNGFRLIQFDEETQLNELVMFLDNEEQLEPQKEEVTQTTLEFSK